MSNIARGNRVPQPDRIRLVHMLAAADIGVEAGLLITDAAHVAVMRELNIRHLATDDADLANIKSITVWMP